MPRPLPAFEVKGIVTSKVFSRRVTHGSSAGPWDISFIVKNGNTVRIPERERERASEPQLRRIGRQFSDLPLRLLSSRLLASSCGSEQLTCHPAALPAATRAEVGRGAPFVSHVKPLVRMFIGVAFLRKGCR